jgi:ADP-ribose pyrophosphatase
MLGFAAMPGSIAERHGEPGCLNNFLNHNHKGHEGTRRLSFADFLRVTVLCGYEDFSCHSSAASCRGLLYIVSMGRASSSRTKSATKKTPHGKKTRLISSRIVYRGPVFWVTADHIQEPGGIEVRRDLIHHSGSVVVLAVDDSGQVPQVLLERQYRHAAGDYLWEIPAGRIDPGETALHAGKRELIEETGYRAKHWRRILKFYASPGFVAETMSVFLATGLRAGEAHPEADEIIYQRMVPLPDAVKMVLRGTIRDGKTIASVLWLDHTLRATTGRKRSDSRRSP